MAGGRDDRAGVGRGGRRDGRRAGAGAWARSIVLRALLIALVWVAVTEADASALVYAAPAIAVGVGVSLVVTGGPARGRRGGDAVRGTARRAAALASLTGWILARSVAGGVDVARRTLRLPHADVDPCWTTVECRLPAGAPRVVFAFVMNLMPGTLTATVRDADGADDGTDDGGSGGEGGRAVLDVHVISPELDVAGAAVELERRLAAALPGPGHRDAS
ncbi:Na+/H+ antiporter subunit E [Litorihabitans aurantiacus]|uniref:Na+/H+ antiporter subunit E n=1 Tax=Litorihabitans aurantiacus TaxID=1930061 RepID=UPI0024E15030|nr:Na+/H+ antiporter subunit E [Litorihabitans aurantiacus]